MVADPLKGNGKASADLFSHIFDFLFYTQYEAVAMCVETCVKISDKSYLNEVIAYTSLVVRSYRV